MNSGMGLDLGPPIAGMGPVPTGGHCSLIRGSGTPGASARRRNVRVRTEDWERHRPLLAGTPAPQKMVQSKLLYSPGPQEGMPLGLALHLHVSTRAWCQNAVLSSAQQRWAHAYIPSLWRKMLFQGWELIIF